MNQAVDVDRRTDSRIQTLRSLFRNLQAFRAAFETDGVSELRDPDGVTWSLWDLEELRRVAVETDLLPLRQRQAIQYFLVDNKSEADVAKAMAIRASNPIGMYATSGLSHLLEEMDAGHVLNPWIDNDKETYG